MERWVAHRTRLVLPRQFPELRRDLALGDKLTACCVIYASALREVDSESRGIILAVVRILDSLSPAEVPRSYGFHRPETELLFLRVPLSFRKNGILRVLDVMPSVAFLNQFEIDIPVTEVDVAKNAFAFVPFLPFDLHFSAEDLVAENGSRFRSEVLG